MIPAIGSLLVLSSLSFAVGAVAGASAPPPPHNPILIDGPEDVATPDALSGNGIRGGTGTASDPYRISDWTITEKPGIAHLVSIQNVEASFRLERLQLSASQISASQNSTVLVSVASVAGITLAGNTFNNGALRFASIPTVTLKEDAYEDALFYAERIPLLVLSNETGSFLSFGISGFHVGTLRISDSQFHFQQGFRCTGCKATVIERSRLSGGGSSATVGTLIQIIGGYGDGVSLEDVKVDAQDDGIEVTFQKMTSFKDVTVAGGSGNRGIKVGENFSFSKVSVAGVRTGIEVTRLDQGTIQSSTFRNISGAAIELQDAAAAFGVENTTFVNVGCGIAASFLPSDDGRPPGSLQGHEIRDLRIHNSSFLQARKCGVFLNGKESRGDARWNWWGGLGAPPVGWCFPKPGLVSPGIQIDPTLKSSPHGLAPLAQDRDECSRFPLPSAAAPSIFVAAMGALALMHRRRRTAPR